MRKNYFQNVKIADKLKMVMKAIFAILLVNNILFAILMLVFGHPVWIINSCHCSSWYAIAFQNDHSGTDRKYS